MLKIKTLLTTLIGHFAFAAAAGAAEDTRVFEMRIYTAPEGKLDALHARFRDHTLPLFEKHGMTNVGYWVPTKNEKNQLIYIVAYASREARKTSWDAFFADEDWKKAKAASEVDGKLVAKVDAKFMQVTDYSPELKIEAADPARLFELRTYTTLEGRLPNINARFADHTIELFEKHGINNVVYFNLMADQEGKDTTLVYLVTHPDAKARGAAFKAFGQDPAWKKARTESVADGAILIKGGVGSIQMSPTDYSPLK
jgi:uncharacterized protein YbaA (DUF1428 family)